jgi:hypothetical protein
LGVDLDGVFAGNTASKTYMVWRVATGRHVIVSETKDDSTLEITAEPGKRYFVWQEVVSTVSALACLQGAPSAIFNISPSRKSTAD